MSCKENTICEDNPFATYEWAQQARAFAHDKPFQSSLLGLFVAYEEKSVVNTDPRKINVSR